MAPSMHLFVGCLWCVLSRKCWATEPRIETLFFNTKSEAGTSNDLPEPASSLAPSRFFEESLPAPPKEQLHVPPIPPPPPMPTARLEWTRMPRQVRSIRHHIEHI
eukprot:Gregarina_sp_Poly_1__965@NODE_1234_length_4694_cov_90_419278_g58_i1_p6_GENE_NODE_1234_length_4694_cov_90_419278_g58_i1NODE_1234_length_4694_cov_90_419278_g58_i1_p6_ORF_typecomplete_len105_score12_85Mito_fiss_reg/PF05308_11/0_19CAP_N/PF01213_19/2_NODE_1234_length_4694_cov_90_419278_g58_i139884302